MLPTGGAGDGRRLVIGEHDGLLGTDPAARRTAALAVVLVLDDDAVQLVHAVDAEQAEIEALHAVGAAAVVDHRIPAPVRLLQQLLGRERRGAAWPAPRRGDSGPAAPCVGLPPIHCLQLRLAPLLALRGDAPHLLDVDLVIVVSRADPDSRCGDPAPRTEPMPLGGSGSPLLVVLVVVGGRDLVLAVVALDAVAVEQPEGGARIHPRQHDHVALDRFQKQPAGVVGIEIVEVGHDRHIEARLHDEGGGDALFQGPAGRVLALGLRQNDGQTLAAHDVGSILGVDLALDQPLGLLPVVGQKLVIFIHAAAGCRRCQSISNSQPSP